MKKLFLLTLLIFTYCIQIDAQDMRLVGTWKWHYDSPYEDGQEGMPPRDECIRIDVVDGKIFVRLKFEGKDGNGRPMQHREEAEDVNENSDGSISFNRFYCKKEYDNDDRLYWTVWTHYTVKYEGGRLLSSETLIGRSYNKNGILVKEELRGSPERKVYYNEKDNR